jgi:hypothetical protein
MYLHDAMILVLKENGSPMHPEDIAAAVNRRTLYIKRDRSPVDKNQISARTSNNQQIFTREDGLIGLLEWRNK